MAEELDWDRAYWIIRIGQVEFAFTAYDRYVAAMGETWQAGFIPENVPGPVLGLDLPDAAPSLRGVDVTLTQD